MNYLPDSQSPGTIVIGSRVWYEHWSRWYRQRAERAADVWHCLPAVIREEDPDQRDVWFYLLMAEYWRPE